MEIITALISILILATLVQFLVDVVKGWLPEVVLRYLTPPLIAAVFGITIALVFNLDLFAQAGYNAGVPIVANVLTGIILSAGSVGIHELIAKLRSSRSDKNY